MLGADDGSTLTSCGAVTIRTHEAPIGIFRIGLSAIVTVRTIRTTVTPVDDPASDLVWYAAYGSNCTADRFRLYLEGGSVSGSDRVHRGARDRTPPRGSGPVTFASAVCFRGHSELWAGAPAFLEHRRAVAPARGALGRRYLITMAQFEDVLAQENTRDTHPVEFPHTPGDTVLAGPGRYDRIVALDPVDGIPVVTFTDPHPPEDTEPAPPSPAYLGNIVRGIGAVHDLTPSAISDHLLTASGVCPTWDHAAIIALFEQS